MKAERGQSLVETLWVLPLVMVIGLGGIQLLWLFLCFQLVQSTAMHVVRQASLDGFNRLRTFEVVEKRMRPMPGRVLHVPLVKRVHPSNTQIRRYGTLVTDEGRRYYQLDTDFALARLDAMPFDERQLWLRARTLQIELVWCQPLQVPMVADMIGYFLRYSLDINQQYCNLQRVGRAPMMAVKGKAAAQLQAPLRVSMTELEQD
ncbi:hypothetical protein CWE12_04370 [Aliidiomarina sedimenti]|uniref:Pilus assembly protein n=1 Tax=Aliidiomarina sedimenti TaxID=1933879 RepID=A0ABY0C319_9GAMM|nr:hypothetical protein [Aliidiomarina sedimenti]RUO32216.1 hypothetical protein CWE12_04370 [Aliidiomarina sedimenti]